METLKHPACTVGCLVAQLCRSWLSMGKATPTSRGRKPNGTIQVKKLKNTNLGSRQSDILTYWRFYGEYFIGQCGFSAEGLVFILQRVFHRSMWILGRGAGFYFWIRGTPPLGARVIFSSSRSFVEEIMVTTRVKAWVTPLFVVCLASRREMSYKSIQAGVHVGT